jgi:hypothetical protein
VDIETRRQKQQALMVKLVERKVRSRAKQLYKTRGEVEGHALQDWVQAESEVLDKSVVAPLYRRLRSLRNLRLTHSGFRAGHSSFLTHASRQLAHLSANSL